SCEVSKAKISSFKTKVVPSSKGRLNLLHMDLCGPMRVSSINAKKYILVIVDDYSRYTWTLFLRSKDETPEVLKEFLIMIQWNLQAPVNSVRIDSGIKFLNKTLHAFFKEEGIEHQTSTPRTPEQNGVVERRNRTLVEAARTMLSASKLPLFFWAEAIATACYTQNRSIIIPTHEKTAYHIINDRKPSIKHLHIFGCTCYLTRDIDVLTKSMNYVPVVAGTNSNDSIGTEESVGTCHSSKETGSSKDYILMPLQKDGSLFGSCSKNASNDEPQPSSDAGKKDGEGVSQESGIDDQERPKNSTQDVNVGNYTLS
ncbi:retrovirus-related pol polyprotein from transposon TNT 1-94, partial [Tanacetum coccineum]